MVNLTGHEAGNGGHGQGTPKARRAFLYSEKNPLVRFGVNWQWLRFFASELTLDSCAIQLDWPATLPRRFQSPKRAAISSPKSCVNECLPSEPNLGRIPSQEPRQLGALLQSADSISFDICRSRLVS